MRQWQWAWLAGLLIAGVLVDPVEGGGPWKGRVVDAETEKPLDGVVVLAVWSRLEASLGGWGADKYHASREVRTGPDGMFEIKSRWTYTIPLVIKVSGPEFILFKPGYGQYRLREPAPRFDEGELTIVEMPRLRTREERLRFLLAVPVPPRVPNEEMERFLEAMLMERRSLGLEP